MSDTQAIPASAGIADRTRGELATRMPGATAVFRGKPNNPSSDRGDAGRAWRSRSASSRAPGFDRRFHAA